MECEGGKVQIKKERFVIMLILFALLFGLFQQVEGCCFFPRIIGNALTDFPTNSIYSPNGYFVAVGNHDTPGQLNIFKSNPNGTLIQASNSPFVIPGSQNFGGIAFSPDNSFFAATSFGTNQIYVFSVDQTSGNLTKVANSPFSTGSAPAAVSYFPNFPESNFIAVANRSSQTVSIYQVQIDDGSLTFVSNASTGTPFNSRPQSMAFTPNGNFLVVVGGSPVNVFSVNQSTGQITKITQAVIPANLNPVSVAISPNGNFVSMLFQGNGILFSRVIIFDIDSQGQLTPINGNLVNSTFNLPLNPNEVVLALSYSPNGEFFAVLTDNHLIIYCVDEVTGNILTPQVLPNLNAFSGNNFSQISFSPDSRFVVIPNILSPMIGVLVAQVPVEIQITSPLNGQIINTPFVTISGITTPNAPIIVFENSTIYCDTVADATGNWSCAISTPLADGSHTIGVGTGSTTSPCASVTFTVLTCVQLAITSPVNGSIVTTNNPVISGTATPGAAVTVTEGSRVLCEVVADMNGNWACGNSNFFSNGPHVITASANGKSVTSVFTVAVSQQSVLSKFIRAKYCNF